MISDSTKARFAKEQQTALKEIERERVRLADLEAELRRGLGDLRWKEEDLAGVRAVEWTRTTSAPAASAAHSARRSSMKRVLSRSPAGIA